MLVSSLGGVAASWKHHTLALELFNTKHAVNTVLFCVAAFCRTSPKSTCSVLFWVRDLFLKNHPTDMFVRPRDTLTFTCPANSKESPDSLVGEFLV